MLSSLESMVLDVIPDVAHKFLQLFRDWTFFLESPFLGFDLV